MGAQASIINVDTVVAELQRVAASIETARDKIRIMSDAVKATGDHQQMGNLISAGERLEGLIASCKEIEDKMHEVIQITQHYVGDVNELEGSELFGKE